MLTLDEATTQLQSLRAFLAMSPNNREARRILEAIDSVLYYAHLNVKANGLLKE